MLARALPVLLAASSTIAAAEAPKGERATAFLPLPSEAPPELFVSQPDPGRLAHGAAVIPYRTENFRILPVFGAGARDISPRAGHLHVSVDGLPWRWADVGDGGAVVVVGLPPGPHSVRIELATPEHGVLLGETVNFVVPQK